jgi:hypothetical protein
LPKCEYGRTDGARDRHDSEPRTGAIASIDNRLEAALAAGVVGNVDGAHAWLKQSGLRDRRVDQLFYLILETKRGSSRIS